MPLKTMQEHWREYIAAVYPQGCTPAQNKECHQAFFAGAMCALMSANAIGEMDEASGINASRTLLMEVRDVNRLSLHMRKLKLN